MDNIQIKQLTINLLLFVPNNAGFVEGRSLVENVLLTRYDKSIWQIILAVFNKGAKEDEFCGEIYWVGVWNNFQ